MEERPVAFGDAVDWDDPSAVEVFYLGRAELAELADAQIRCGPDDVRLPVHSHVRACMRACAFQRRGTAVLPGSPPASAEGRCNSAPFPPPSRRYWHCTLKCCAACSPH